MYKSACWQHILVMGLSAEQYVKLQDEVWECYKFGFRTMPEWNIFKNQIRTICLSMGSPRPHDEPLDNISELRLHLSHHNDLYETIQKLNDKIETQQRIITNLSFRHLLEHLSPINGNKSEAERWDDFWKKACAQAVADQKNPPSEGETNAEHKAKRDAKRSAGREKASEKTSESSDRRLKNDKSRASTEISASSEAGLESKNDQVTSFSKVPATVSIEYHRILVQILISSKISGRLVTLKAEPNATSSSEVRPEKFEAKELLDSKPLGDVDPKLQFAQKAKKGLAAESSKKTKQTTAESSGSRGKEIDGEKPPGKALPHSDIMSQPYEISPLVEVLEKCRPQDRDPPASSDEVIKPIGGANMYRILSQNIHGFEQEEDAYSIKQSQWNNIEFQILSALKPRLDNNKRVDWQKERARFVSPF